MLPLDFLTAVYRDELYDEYERKSTADGRAFYFVPTKSAKRIVVSLEQRISAAQHAAPYIHRKMPQGIEVEDVTVKRATAAQLAKLPQKDLLLLSSVLDKLEDQGAPPSLAAAAIQGAKTYTQEGEEIDPTKELA